MDLSKIKYKTVLIGYKKSQVNWTCLINGYEFSYFTGIGYIKTLKQVKDIPAANRRRLDVNDTDFKLILSKTSLGRSEHYYNINMRLFVECPKLEHVLNCLLLDSYAYSVSFRDWCSEFGYNDDSIQAKSIYETCIENYHNLRKALGPEYSQIEMYIRSLEL